MSRPSVYTTSPRGRTVETARFLAGEYLGQFALAEAAKRHRRVDVLRLCITQDGADEAAAAGVSVVDGSEHSAPGG